MLEEVLTYLNNWFPGETWNGKFAVSDAAMELPLHEGQYFRIIGSKLNDGLHRYPADDLIDEAFTGSVQECIIPKPLLKLADEIAAWCEQYGDASASPFDSESFGGYSYSKGSSGSGNGDAASGWIGAFEGRLSRWKKL